VLFAGVSWRPERFTYVEVAARRVRHRAVAEAALRWAARDLSISPPRMRFFASIDLAPAYAATTLAFCADVVLRGLAYRANAASDGEIWINADLPRRTLVATVAHEVKHVAQAHRDDAERNHSDVDDESEAERYGRRVGRGPAARRVGGHVSQRWARVIRARSLRLPGGRG